MRRIGLTGNIACGKSTAARILTELGYTVLDADLISKKLCEKGQPGYDQIVKAFGFSLLEPSGELDRQKLRDTVFLDANKKIKLEAILHPLILKESTLLMEKAEQSQNSKNALFYEASLIFEAGREKEFEGILLITCATPLQLHRLLKRNPNLSKEMAEKIISSQSSQDDKAKKARWVIENSSDEASFRTKITEWAKKNL